MQSYSKTGTVKGYNSVNILITITKDETKLQSRKQKTLDRNQGQQGQQLQVLSSPEEAL